MMDCENTAHSLPWLLNGSLDPAEEAELRRHLAECADCRRELDETRAAWEVYAAHLPTEVLVDLAFGRPVDSIAGEVIERHLEGCAECAGELALARESAARAEIGGGEAAVRAAAPFRPAASGAAGAGWRRLAAAAGVAGLVAAGGWLWSLQSTRSLSATLTAERAAQQEQTRALDSQIAELRAGLAALRQAAGGNAAGAQAEELARRLTELEADRDRLQRTEGDLRRRIDELTAPQLNVAIVDVYSSQLRQRGDGPPPADAVPRDAKPVTLILNPAPGVGEAPVEVEMVDAAGKLLLRRSGLRLSPTSDFTLTLPTAALPAGPATINLYRPGAGGSRTLVDSFHLELR